MNSIKDPLSPSKRANGIAAVFAVLMMAVVLAGAARARQNAVTRQDCISNIGNWGKAVILYAQDYDEVFPIFSSDAQLEAQIKVYHDHNFDLRPMRSPFNGYPYHANPDLSGRVLASFGDFQDTIPVLTETVPSIGKVPFVAAFDGRVYQNGIQADDSVEASARNAQQLTTSLLMYAQDYDETLPLKMDASSLKISLYPYLKTMSVFRVSPKGGDFVFDATLGGKTLGQLPRTNEVIVLRTPSVPASFFPIYGTLAGRTYVQGKEYLPSWPPNPTPIEVISARRLAVAVLFYAQDHDETFPDTANLAHFKTQVSPYVQSLDDLKTPSGKDYLLNPDLSNLSFAAIAEPSNTELFRSPELLYTGARVIAYADGHVKAVHE